MAPLIWLQSTAITAVRDTIGDPDGAATERWTDAEIASYLDRAGLVTVLDTGVILRTAWDFSLVDATAEYVMAENFVEAHRVKWWKGGDSTDQRDLTYCTFQQFMDLNTKEPEAAGEPKYYTLWNKLLTDTASTMQPPIMMLYPVSATGGTDSDTVRVWGVKTPDVLASAYTNAMELQGQHVEAQVCWAASLAFWDDDEPGKAQAMEARYQRLVEKIKHDEARRDRSSRPMIRPRESRLNGYSFRTPSLPQDFYRKWGV